jgi:hypothetical protein
MDLAVKCQLLVTQILIHLQGSLCSAFGVSNGTEAGFACCGGFQACHEAGVHTVLLLSSDRLEQEKTSYSMSILSLHRTYHSSK